MTQRRDINDDEVIQQLEEHGRSWRDYFLVGDPPLICSGGENGFYALVIEEDELASATISLLIARGARRFHDIEAFKTATGWDGEWRPPE
jgi:hypothetical protein